MVIRDSNYLVNNCKHNEFKNMNSCQQFLIGWFVSKRK